MVLIEMTPEEKPSEKEAEAKNESENFFSALCVISLLNWAKIKKLFNLLRNIFDARGFILSDIFKKTLEKMKKKPVEKKEEERIKM